MAAVALLPLAVGLVTYGSAVVWIVAASIIACVVGQRCLYWLARRHRRPDDLYAVMLALLLALTMPPTAGWLAVLAASLIAVLTTGLMGGPGRQLWHPALIGRVAVQVLFAQQLAPDRWAQPFHWPLLGSGHLLIGDLSRACPAEHYVGWQASVLPPGCDAWLLVRPVRILRWLAEGHPALADQPDHPLLVLIRDALPPWHDTLLGLTPGAIGEGSAIALILAGLYLIYRGYLRWQLPIAILAAAAVAAAILPVSTAGKTSWLPGLAIADGLPVGLLYVLYHLTSGELMLAALLLANRPAASPASPSGEAIFAGAIGVLTIFLRLYGPMPCAAYWAVLIMNTFVPVIDRYTEAARSMLPPDQRV